MSDFVKNENTNWQKEVREKLERLRDSLDDRYCRWGEWERTFIVSVIGKLNQDIIDISPKQYTKVWDLWERSLK